MKNYLAKVLSCIGLGFESTTQYYEDLWYKECCRNAKLQDELEYYKSHRE